MGKARLGIRCNDNVSDPMKKDSAPHSQTWMAPPAPARPDRNQMMGHSDESDREFGRCVHRVNESRTAVRDVAEEMTGI